MELLNQVFEKFNSLIKVYNFAVNNKSIISHVFLYIFSYIAFYFIMSAHLFLYLTINHPETMTTLFLFFMLSSIFLFSYFIYNLFKKKDKKTPFEKFDKLYPGAIAYAYIFWRRKENEFPIAHCSRPHCFKELSLLPVQYVNYFCYPCNLGYSINPSSHPDLGNLLKYVETAINMRFIQPH